MQHFVRLLALVLAGLASTAQSAPLAIECPSSIAPTATVTNAPPGWSVVSGEASSPFDSLAIFDGNPSELASLVPDRDLPDTKVGARGEAEWDFEGGARNIWVGCSYSRTTVSLAQAIPDGSVKCRVQATHESNGWQLAPKVVCE
ncbi:MAG: STY0301 family protein [Dokdonella sp.]